MKWNSALRHTEIFDPLCFTWTYLTKFRAVYANFLFIIQLYKIMNGTEEVVSDFNCMNSV